MKNTQKGFSAFLLFVLVLLITGAGIYFYIQNPNNPLSFTEPSARRVACTEDSMMCSDGSFVGRTGPNCEFVCPTASDKQTVSIDIVVPNPPTQDNNPFIGVAYLKSNFKVTTVDGKLVSVLVGELKRTYLDMPHDSTTPADNWFTFYSLVKNRDAEYKGMPTTIKIKGYWIDDTTFEATEISWQIG